MADCISTVNKYEEDLKLHVMRPVDSKFYDIFCLFLEIQSVKRTENDLFCKLIETSIINLQDAMQPKLEQILRDKLLLIKRVLLIIFYLYYSNLGRYTVCKLSFFKLSNNDGFT